MTLADISIKRPVFAWMLMSALMVFGLISFSRMGVSQLPDVDFPVVSIQLTWEGAAPEVMETDVVDVVEEAMTTIQGVRDISSSVRQGTATVTVELELNRDVDVAVQEIQAKLSQAQRRLPTDMDPAIITKTNPEDQPIIWLTATGEIPLRDLMDYIQNHLKDRFATVNGVGEVFLGGFLERNLRVWVDQKKLETYQLTVQDIINAVQAGHAEIPAGRIETPEKELNVRAMGEALTPEEFGNIIISRRGGQPIYKPLYIKDVATVEDGLDDVRRISRTNGKFSVGMGMRKQRGVNEIEVAKRIYKRMEEVKKELPEGVSLNLVVDRTKFSEESVKELKFTLVLSAIVTSFVCWLFLGSWTATVNILLAIPTSILGTFIFLYFLGFTLNTFTLMGLSLAIGIVVDDAIMVLENIVRYLERGMGRIQAAAVGARQITFAATATTIAIVAIFLPIAFMTGVVGRFFYQYAVTITIAVALSLLEALTLTPMRCSQFLDYGKRFSRFGKVIDEGFVWLAKAYHTTLLFALRRPKTVIAAAGLFFVLSLSLIGILRKEFVPAQDQSMLFCRLQTPAGSSLEFTDNKFKEAEKRVLARPEVLRYFCAIGGFGGGEINTGIIFITLRQPHERPIVAPFTKRPAQKDLMAYFRKELNKIPDLKVIIQDLSLSGFSSHRGFPIEMTILGRQWDKLAELNTQIQNEMKKSALLIDVDSNYDDDVSEIRVYPNREKANERGVAIEDIGQTINALIAGERIAKYTQGGRRYDVRIRLVPEQRLKMDDINSLWVWNNRGEMVQLKDVISIGEKKTSLTISRRNRERAIAIYANVAPGKSQADAIKAANQIATKLLPEGYHAIFSGSSETFKESFSSLSFVLWLGILVAYMVLASQFNSYIHPFTILLALPFSVTGALIALWISGQSINIYSLIGIILLMGIVKKNSIMLVDFTNQVRARGANVHDALVEACPIRLRPILMTSFATIAAAIPPALALGSGAEILRPMATTVIGGVFVSTIFTLVVIPCVYSLVARFERVKSVAVETSDDAIAPKG